MKESFTTKQDYYENLINTDSNTDNRNTFYFSQENNQASKSSSSTTSKYKFFYNFSRARHQILPER